MEISRIAAMLGAFWAPNDTEERKWFVVKPVSILIEVHPRRKDSLLQYNPLISKQFNRKSAIVDEVVCARINLCMAPGSYCRIGC